MLKWFTSIADGVRIAFDYFEFERECREDWEREARERYSCTELRSEIARRMAGATKEASRQFDDQILVSQRKKTELELVARDARERLRILERDYQGELDAAYASLNLLKEQLRTCREELSDAHDTLNAAKSDLDSWYRRAEGNWIGNGGKPLPKNSIFGQSIADRDRLKSRRESAAREIGRIKTRRSALEQDSRAAGTRIGELKQHREAMHALRSEGFDLRLVKGTLATATEQANVSEREFARLTAARHEYLAQAKRALGVVELEQQVWQRERDLRDRIAAFNGEPERQSRRARHRQMWMAAHGRK
ncbi:MAG: hypothetical protein K0S57_86 [Ramlibacter sp.]|nr:hypothetical protein [Ramlibacter sp.]